MSLLLYLVGAPGVGKTTVMSALTAGYGREPQSGSVPHDRLTVNGGANDGACRAVEVGRRRGTFSGTDALSMSIQPKAVQWIAQRPHRLVLAEGARLANEGFLRASAAAGYRVLLVHLDAPAEVLADRRRTRGSSQNPGWMRGAETRARNIAARMELEATVLRLDANTHPNTLAKEITAADPELEGLLCWS
jgi:shikimate kinase